MNKEDAKAHARARRAQELAARRDGRYNRAKTQDDQRKRASKRACRNIRTKDYV